MLNGGSSLAIYGLPISWFERLLSLVAGPAHAKVADGTSKEVIISPDGRFLYVAGLENTPVQDENGEMQIISTPLGLQVIRIADRPALALPDLAD